MSRIIVKNLPKTITAKKLEKLFSSKGTITDLQLKYTKDGIFRQFAFVGYKTEEEADAAKEYFDNTFVYTSKIQVDKCADPGDPNKPKPWKKQIPESNEESVDKLKESKKKKKKRKSDEVFEEEKEGKKKKKRKSEEIPEELLEDAQFKEFLEVNKSRQSKPVWAEDIDAEPGGTVGSSSDSDYDSNYKQLENSIESDEIEDSVKTKKKKTKTKIENGKTTNKENQSDDKASTKKLDTFNDAFTVKLRNLPYHCKKKQIKEFFQNLKIESLRIPPKIKGIAYVKFKTEIDFKRALHKSKGFLDGRRVDVIKYMRKADEVPKFKNAEVENSQEANEALLAETGRIFVRNLYYKVTEEDLKNLFGKYGPLTEVHLPIDKFAKQGMGIAFVTFVFPEHAVQAFTKLDNTSFQGRLMHLIPSKPKKITIVNENEPHYKKKKEAMLQQSSGSSHNWNIVFLGMNAVADVISKKYNVEKTKLLSGDSKGSVGVRLALAETEMVMKTREFLVKNGVQLDAFSQPDAEESKTVIVAKDLPATVTQEFLEEKFSPFGVCRVIMPPSGLVALIEFEDPKEAETAFYKLAYRRIGCKPLYLQWAPMGAVQKPPEGTDSDSAQGSSKDDDGVKNNEETEVSPETPQTDAEDPAAGTTVFVRNLNFDTTDEALRKHFKKCGSINYATVSTKTDIKTGKLLSMGFGFVQFENRESAVNAIQNLQFSKLDGHAIELKFAKREISQKSHMPKKKYEVKKQLSSKILVRNIPFQASEREVKELFSHLGMLKSVRLPKKADGSGEHRGFGFVEFQTKDNAERAFNALCHSTHLYGRRLVLEWANTNSDDVEELRKRTAKTFVDGEPKKKTKKRKLNEDVALTAAKHSLYDE